LVDGVPSAFTNKDSVMLFDMLNEFSSFHFAIRTGGQVFIFSVFYRIRQLGRFRSISRLSANSLAPITMIRIFRLISFSRLGLNP